MDGKHALRVKSCRKSGSSLRQCRVIERRSGKSRDRPDWKSCRAGRAGADSRILWSSRFCGGPWADVGLWRFHGNCDPPGRCGRWPSKANAWRLDFGFRVPATTSSPGLFLSLSRASNASIPVTCCRIAPWPSRSSNRYGLSGWLSAVNLQASDWPGTKRERGSVGGLSTGRLPIVRLPVLALPNMANGWASLRNIA